MKSLLTKVLAPFLLVGTAVAGLFAAVKLGWISAETAFWLIPVSLTVIFVLVAIFAGIKVGRVWLWPTGALAIVQLIATLVLLLSEDILESHWDPLKYSIGATAAVLVIMLIVWIFSTVRARMLEKNMAGGSGTGADLERIQKDMRDALDLLRRAGQGRNAVYQLPWFLVILLRKYRGRQPLDGLIVVVPADDLIGLSEDELEDQATNVREVVDLIHEQLDFRFPIYVLVTKCDLIEGFVDFFRGLPAKRRHEILGWSNPDPNESNAETIVEKGFGIVQRRLQSYRLEMLGEPKVVKRTQARRLFFFTEEFRGLERPLAAFTSALFGGDRYSEPPVFRGFYFSSGTQEGAPLGKAISGVAKAFGIAPPKTEEAGEEGNKRSYFLLELFRELMVGDDGLVGRSAAHWWRRRRNTALGVFAPAAIALSLLLLSGLALGLNRGTYSRIAANVDEITAELKEIRDKRLLPKVGIQEALEETERLRTYHKQMTGFSPFRTFGMRRPQGLADETLALFAEEFSRSVLRPTLDHARDIVETDNSCVARIQVLRGVVWLRTGPRAGYDDLAGLDRIWGLEGETRKQEERAIGIRKDLQRQFAYLKRALEGVPDADEILLPGFKIGEAAKAILDYCGEQGATSAAEGYRRWQEECSRLETDAKSVHCYDRLNSVLHSAGVDYRTFRLTFEGLQEDLEELASEVPGGGDAREYLAQIPMGEEQTSECLSSFNLAVVPPMKAYAIKNDFVETCRNAVRGRSRGERAGIRQEILKDQIKAVEEEESEFAGVLLNFNAACKSNLQGLSVDLNVVRNVTSTFRRVACYEDEYSRITSRGVQASTKTTKNVWRPPKWPRSRPTMRPAFTRTARNRTRSAACADRSRATVRVSRAAGRPGWRPSK